MKRSYLAFTLIELIVVIAIIGVLAAILLAAMGPVRERARQATCTSNLHQIYIATQLYSEDYNGRDIEQGQELTYNQLGFPCLESIRVLGKKYLKSSAVLFCPDDPEVIKGPGVDLESTYDFVPCLEGPPIPEGQRFSHMVAIRGEQMPLIADRYHNWLTGPQPRWARQRILLVRMDGHFENELIPYNVIPSTWF
ncbi:MAG TPA: type II secretion system protein [Armatimonadota bacterium]|nr:type II secretion system protein [Armatimonadota bacterium]